MNVTSPVETSEADRVIKFLATYCRHSKDVNTGEAFYVEPWQEAFLREAYKADPLDTQRRFYQRVFLCVPARNGKSSLAAGLVLYHFLFDPYASNPVVLCAAASGSQADVVFGAASEFVYLNPTLKKKLTPLRGTGTIRHKTKGEGKLGVVRRVNAEAGNLFGIDASTIVLDELHTVPDAMYDVLSSRIYSRNSPFFLSISTAGGNKAGILGRIYDESHQDWSVLHDETGHFAASDSGSRSLIWWFGAADNADIADPHVWTSCNPSSWMDESKLRQIYNASKSNESSFRRQHLNQWSSGAGALLPTGVWQSLRNTSVKILPGDRVLVGVDVATTRDYSAVVMVGPEKGGLRPVVAKVFEPSPDTFMPKEVAEYIRHLAETYTLESVAFDPTFFGSEANELSQQGFNMVQFDQTMAKIAAATEKFRELALEKKLCHDGDPILASHIANCGVRTTPSGGLAIKKLGAESHKMDAAAALIAACFLVGNQKPTPSLFFV